MVKWCLEEICSIEHLFENSEDQSLSVQKMKVKQINRFKESRKQEIKKKKLIKQETKTKKKKIQKSFSIQENLMLRPEKQKIV